MRKLKQEENPRGYLSSSRQVGDFIEGVVWKDLEKELKEWLEQILDDLVENATGDDIHLQRGRAQVLKKVLLLPQVMYESLKMEEDINRETRNR